MGGIPCVICKIRPKSKTGRGRDFKLCNVCFHEILDFKKDYQLNNGKLHTKCKMCGKDINHRNTTPTCQTGGCRAKWYREEKETKILGEAFLSKDYSQILHYTIRTIRKYGFDVLVTKE